MIIHSPAKFVFGGISNFFVKGNPCAYQLGTGIIDPNFAPVLDQGPVYTVVAGPDNTVYVGGSFTTVNGVSEPGLVQLSVAPGDPTDGQVVPGFAAPLSGTVHALALGGDSLYVGGNFRTQIKNGIVRVCSSIR